MRRASLLIVALLLALPVVTADPPETELVAVSLAVPDTLLKEGTRVTFAAILRNDGPDTATDVLVGFYVDGTGVGRSSDPPILVTLPPGEAVTVVSHVWRAKVGVQTATVHVDDNEAFPELNEFDNDAFGSFEAYRPDLPNLRMDEVTADVTPYGSGAMVAIRGHGVNDGAGFTSGWTYGTSVDGVEVSRNWVPMGTGPQDLVGGGGPTRFYRPGAYEVTRHLDDTHAIEESNESDNSAATSFTVQDPGPSDLVILGYEATDETLVHGQVVGLRMHVANQGPNMMHGTRASATIGDWSRAAETGPLAPGASTWTEWIWLYARGGSTEIAFAVDVPNFAHETDETNNELIIPIVLEKPDALVRFVRAEHGRYDQLVFPYEYERATFEVCNAAEGWIQKVDARIDMVGQGLVGVGRVRDAWSWELYDLAPNECREIQAEWGSVMYVGDMEFVAAIEVPWDPDGDASNNAARHATWFVASPSRILG